ncbi:hypothetical protein [Brevibacterium casei]|uniref:hypothetical protein n=1 Tax=Brevibacterium casei TaxID=33889 RepID=UPI0028ACA0CE|nr:hypothetical protein [Brevibacterium casei]
MRIAASILVGVIAYLFGFFTSSMAVTANAWAFSDGKLNDTGLVTVLLLFLVWGLVFLRHRWPWVPFVAGGLLTAGWGDAPMLLIAIFHLVIRAPRRQAITASAVGTGLIAFSTLRMCLAPVEHNPFSIFFLPDPAQVTGLEATIPPEDSHLALIHRCEYPDQAAHEMEMPPLKWENDDVLSQPIPPRKGHLSGAIQPHTRVCVPFLRR